MSDFISLQIAEGVCTLSFNRPEKKNAITGAMYLQMAEAFEAAGRDDNIRVLLITSNNENFTVGNDLEDFLKHPPSIDDAPVIRFLNSLIKTHVPLIAAVDGLAVGIGATLLLHCDFVYATPRTSFSMPFVNLGVTPEALSSLLLPRLAGYQRAAEVLMLGEPFGVERAHELGFITAVCEPSQLMQQARDTALRLAQKPPAALRHTKQLLRCPEEPLADRLARESAVFAERLKSPAAREIMTAFLEKRPPDPKKFD